MKNFTRTLSATLILSTITTSVLAGSDGGYHDAVAKLNRYNDIHHLFFGGQKQINIATSHSTNATSTQYIQLANGAVAQNFSGTSGIQSSVTGSKNHKIVTYTNGQSSITSIANQTINLSGGAAQNCAASKCIQISE